MFGFFAEKTMNRLVLIVVTGQIGGLSLLGLPWNLDQSVAMQYCDNFIVVGTDLDEVQC